MSASSDYAVEYVEAVKDYDYKNDKGEHLSMTIGTYYILLERTNAEWWHIQNIEDPPKEFYVPANYVKSLGKFPEDSEEVFEEEEEDSEGEESGELSEEEPVKIIVPKGKPLPEIPVKAKSSVTGIKPRSAHRVSSFGKPLSSTPPPDYNDENQESPQNQSGTGSVSTPPQQKIVCVEIDESPTIQLPETDGTSAPEKDVNSPVASKPVTPQEKKRTGHVPPPSVPPSYEPVMYANLDELRGIVKSPGTEVVHANQSEYANLSAIQAVIKPPSAPNPNNFLKTLSDNWDLYGDTESGRQFYYNSVTKETTWKPPRGVEKLLSDGETDPNANEKALETNGDHDVSKTGPAQVIPRGWKEEKAEDGGKAYVNQITKQKWFASVDSKGRRYFYNDGSRESVWQLPELVVPSQSVSDCLSHVDIESRRAALRDRLSKTKSMYVEGLERLDPQRKSTTLPSNMLLPTTAKENNNTEEKDLLPAILQSTQNPVFPREPKDRFLNKAKVMENGKKLKKNWSLSYVVLAGSNLVFYKDQKAAQTRPGSPHGKPDFVISLTGANVEFGAKDLSSKKNLILLTTARSNEDVTQYLLQNDDNNRIHLWYITLTETVQRLRSGVELTTDVNGSPGKVSPLPSETEKLKRGKSTKSKPTAGINRSVSSDEAASQERKRRIRDILFNFISRRPSPEVLKEKGIIKDVVFGCELKLLCQKEGASVPFFIKHIISCIEHQGLNHDGMYRISGNSSQIQKLRCMVDQGEKYNFDDPSVWDINVLTGSLKMFFRELKEPLFPFNSYDKFVEAIQVPHSSGKMKAFKEQLAALPKCNHETLKFLFKHLKKVTDQSKENRMQSHNLAIVFGPTLLWPELKAPNMAVSLVFQNRIVEFILLEYDSLFR